ncbi:MAG: metalloregulator ArsR/SmtB family transcription factor [Oceanipulchritudo sp.]
MDAEDLARCLWTIGDLTRLRILELLPSSPDCSDGKNVTELAGLLDLKQSTVSNHLARMRTLGIVRHTKHCRDVYYWVDPYRAEEIVNQLQRSLKLVQEVERAGD